MSAARVDDDAAANLGKGEALWLRDPVNEAVGGEIQAAYATLGESEKNAFDWLQRLTQDFALHFLETRP